ncbi:hypothetical protein L332_04060 [Agrococcus pavilionensis RW1]|uniref:DUF58 domain-containing protein n=1 Tax=Agrococcus pavilionensis RW1 TaxID=1330458 RepID=U1L9F8_9MICO|nr:DUF58 domain-containing protein [Agrococcus pavilionensis]ERG63628.1 hypothetical protein L332_04060 [Agrococcus pavilionensis RW1]
MAARVGRAARDRSRSRLTPRGFVLVLAGLGLVLAAYWERQVVLLVPAALCLGVVALGLWWAIGAVGRVRLGVPGVIAEGQSAALRIVGDARQVGARWSTWAPGPERFLLLEGDLGEGAQASVELGSHPRGRWRLAPVEVTTLDPFRVVRTTRAIDPRASLVVGPEVLAVGSSELRSNRTEGRLAQSRTADEVDAMVREWRPGDPQRRVHWRQSAKRGELMVRQEANPATDDDIVVVDTARAAGRGRDAEDRLARAACSIALALAGRDRAVQVRETGEPSLPAADWRDLRSALAAFASFEAHAADEPRPMDADAAHVVALEEAAPEGWSLAPGTTLWLVARPVDPPRRISAGSRVAVHRWIDRAGPVRELA